MAKNSKRPGWPQMMTPPFSGFAGAGDQQTTNPMGQSLTSGLDFMKNLWGGLPSNVPGFVVPTVDIGELDKRIEDLKAVESWLALNANMLKATIQGLEVQRNTLAALQALREKGDLFNAMMQPGSAFASSKGAAAKASGASSAPTPPPGAQSFEELFGMGTANANWPLAAKTAANAVTTSDESDPDEDPDAPPHEEASQAAPPSLDASQRVTKKSAKHPGRKKHHKSGHVAAPKAAAPAAASVAAQSANMWLNFLKDQFSQIASSAVTTPAGMAASKTTPARSHEPPLGGAAKRRPAAKKAAAKRRPGRSTLRTKA